MKKLFDIFPVSGKYHTFINMQVSGQFFQLLLQFSKTCNEILHFRIWYICQCSYYDFMIFADTDLPGTHKNKIIHVQSKFCTFCFPVSSCILYFIHMNPDARHIYRFLCMEPFCCFIIFMVNRNQYICEIRADFFSRVIEHPCFYSCPLKEMKAMRRIYYPCTIFTCAPACSSAQHAPNRAVAVDNCIIITVNQSFNIFIRLEHFFFPRQTAGNRDIIYPDSPVS